jgi:AcrR family transcriptional regulator
MPRRDKRSDASRERMIETAERLFAEHGLYTVPLRQIGAEAGSSNKVAVQYHFGDRAGLIQAIFEKRLAEFETRRAALLAATEAAGRAADPRALMDIIFRPLAEQRDSAGRRSYAAFLLALQLNEADYRLRAQADPMAPITRRVMERLAASAPHVPRALLFERSLAASVMILSGIVRRDHGDKPAAPDDALIDDALDAATAAVTAPVSPAVLAALQVPRG